MSKNQKMKFDQHGMGDYFFIFGCKNVEMVITLSELLSEHQKMT